MAAVAAATDSGEPPPILQAVWRCRNWGIPPPDDYVLMHQMEQVEMAYGAVRDWHKSGPKPLSGHQLKVIDWLMKVEAM